MKKYILILVLFVSGVLNAQNFKTPNDYLTYVGNETDALSNSIWQYTSAIAHSRSVSYLDQQRLNLLNDCKNITRKVKGLTNGYNGDVEYKNQLLDYFTLIESEINTEYKKATEIQNGLKSFEEIEKYTLERSLANNIIKEQIDKLNVYQKVFADKYQIKITENDSPVGVKMKISNEVFKYHSKFYLIFLKINMAESNLIDAISKNDLAATEKNLEVLRTANSYGYSKLKLIEAYKDDKTLLEKTQTFLDFTKKEIAEFGDAAVNYLKIKKNFDVQKELLEKKINLSNKEREDYNNAAQEKNFSFKAYARINDYYNAEREKIIKDWNLTGDKFIDAYVPAN